MDKTYIGIDNGVSGKIGIICDDGIHLINTPIKSEQNYTKTKQMISRIDFVALEAFLGLYFNNGKSIAVLERPMTNPTRYRAAISAARALEATLCVIESFGMPYQYIDSRKWQRELLPKGTKGSSELKKAGVDVSRRLFPQIDCGKDADGLLIAEWARRNNL